VVWMKTDWMDLRCDRIYCNFSVYDGNILLPYEYFIDYRIDAELAVIVAGLAYGIKNARWIAVKDKLFEYDEEEGCVWEVGPYGGKGWKAVLGLGDSIMIVEPE